MRRGDVIVVALAGEFGKPRPALVVQSNLFADHQSVTVCLITSHSHESPLFRYSLQPGRQNGLTVPSQVQIDKLMTLRRDKIGQIIGTLTDKQMSEVTRLLALWIGIADV